MAGGFSDRSPELSPSGEWLSVLKSLDSSEIAEVLGACRFCSECHSVLKSRVVDFVKKKSSHESYTSNSSSTISWKTTVSSTISYQQQSNHKLSSHSKETTSAEQMRDASHFSPPSVTSKHKEVDLFGPGVPSNGNHRTSFADHDGLSEEQELRRMSQVGRKKDFVLYERVNRKEINVLQGLELHTGVFDAEEQKKIVECVYKLQKMGQKGQLMERTYSEPSKWMRGKGRVTLQFGCCYNYAVDKDGNPPGIIRSEEVDPMPPFFKKMIQRLVRWHVLPPTCVPNSCIVNIYDEGDCIPPHIDHHDFVRPFCTVSFLTQCNILFGASLKIEGPGEFSGPVSIPLPVGSVLLLKGNGADVAKHCVPAVPSKRISVTFRKMDDSKIPRNFSPDPDLLNIKPLVRSAIIKPDAHEPQKQLQLRSVMIKPDAHEPQKARGNGNDNSRRDGMGLRNGASFVMENDDFPPLGGRPTRKR